MVDDKLEIEELERSANYEAIKSSVKGEVGGEIAAEAQVAAPAEARRIDNIASHMREKAVDEVIDTEREVERGRTLARVSQVVDYIFFIKSHTHSLHVAELFVDYQTSDDQCDRNYKLKCNKRVPESSISNSRPEFAF